MLIIVEGPDGAGKSTLIDKLLKSNPGSLYRHFSNPKTDDEAFGYWKIYVNAIKETDPTKVTIFDRSWYSDRVYAPIFRGREEMDSLHVEMLENTAVMHGGAVVIYCTAPVSVLWQRCKKRGEDFVKTSDQLAAIHAGYCKVMRDECKLPCIRYDTNVRW